MPQSDERAVEAGQRQRSSALSRRLFLARGSMTVVAAGVVSAMPALPAAVSAAESEAPAAESEVGAGVSMSEPLVAQVKNLQTGEVSLYTGEREISILDRGLAARLYNAAK
ncbi:MAG TPA: hypothetical protein VME70_02680 [Mycobacteriales bacterium]|nr:hypothetical protein [Mycobacteriales bacterium]